MNEQHHRRLERKNLVYFPEIYNADSDKIVGRIIDVTTEGFLVVGDNPIEEGTEFRASVKWVDEMRKESSFDCFIQVVWCKDDINPDYKAIGCKIEEMSTSDKENIKRLIRKWGFPSWK